MNPEDTAPTTTAEDMNQSRQWLSRLFAGPSELPVSFVLDGKATYGIPQQWRPQVTRRTIDANIHETIFEGNDPATSLNLRVECTEYRDYPVMEWVAWLTNKGSDTTPIIRDIRALDAAFPGSSPVLHHSSGDFGHKTGYTPSETPVQPQDTLEFAPLRGRSCDGAFPYYRLVFDGCGLSLAIGWPGTWSASFNATDDGVRIRAGQQNTNLRLEPGETIRTPRITIMSWKSDVTRAINLWRRWYHAHVLPRPNGQPLKPLLAGHCPGDGEEFTAATEENQLQYIELAKQRGIDFDLWWIDAGWYPCYNENRQRDWPVVGTWRPDPERFPRGLKSVSDALDRHGAKLLLWFEPERVRDGTQLEIEHPEWLLKMDDQGNSLLNLGNPQCRQWLTDHVCKLIRDNGVKIYRQDFNRIPLDYSQNEPDDRQGMSENLHVQGYLQYWDDLLARNPGLWIDSCSSGGRRNDLEAMRRSVPLHYTDYGYGDHPVKLAFHRTLFEWIPYFNEKTVSWDIDGHTRFDHCIDSFSFHCAMAAMLFPTMDIRRDDHDYALAVKMIAIWRRASNLILYGDYYQHTPFHRSSAEWVAWQFDCPETNRGILQAIRLPQSHQDDLTIHPKAIQPDAHYVFENDETAETRDISGKDLIQNGFTFSLPPRSGAIWFYRRNTD